MKQEEKSEWEETRQDKRRGYMQRRRQGDRRGEKERWKKEMIKLPWELPSDTMKRERERWRETAAADTHIQLFHDLQQIHSSSFWGNIPHWTCYNKINVSPYSWPKTVIYAQPREKSRAPVSTRIQMQTKEPKTAIWQKCRQRIQHLHIHKSQSNMWCMSFQKAQRRQHNTAWGGSNTIIRWPFGAISKQLQFVKQA